MTDDSDSDLLRRFVAQRDQAAFAALIARHAPLVLGVCRRVLDNHHDAEDAAQAAFLMLARRAEQLVPPLGPWLYRVALNLARNALRDRRSRQRVQREAAAMPQTDSPPERFTAEIDSALATLPEGERAAITLFHLEGRPVEEVAQLVGRPVGTVCSWLARGRERLRRQLTRRGVAVPLALLATALGGLSAVEVPAGFATTTAAAAASFLGGSAATPAAALASQGIKTMAIISTVKTTLVAAGLAAALGAAGWIAAAEGAGGAAKKGGDLLGAADFAPTADHPVGWRGDGTGRYPGATPPTAWGRARSGSGYESKGILWSTPLPNRSVSSPIVVGQRIFLTTEPADLVCIDKPSGRILWIRSNSECEIPSGETSKSPDDTAPLMAQLAKLDQDLADALNAEQASAPTSAFKPPAAIAKKKELEKQLMAMAISRAGKKDEYLLHGAQGVFGYAGPTATSDGKRVCAFFTTGISVCYDLDGNRKWLAHPKAGGAEHGNFASPLLCDNQFIIWGGFATTSFDAESGKQLWSNGEQGGNTYGSLFRLRVGGELVAAFQNGFFSRVRDGKLIWDKHLFADQTSTPIVEGDLIYAYAGVNAGAGMKAFKIPASTEGGKVTQAFVCQSDWADDLPDKNFGRGTTASPLYVGGLLYQLTEGGGLMVNDASNGEVVYRKILPMKTKTSYWNYAGASASPTLAGKYIYLLDNQGGTVVIEPGRQYKEIARNQIDEIEEADWQAKDGKSQNQILATPFFDGTRMYLRTPTYLYCIGEK